MFVGCPIQQSVDIRYYVIVVLFLIFELEVILLLAWLGSSTSSVYSGGLFVGCPIQQSVDIRYYVIVVLTALLYFGYDLMVDGAFGLFELHLRCGYYVFYQGVDRLSL